MGYDSRPETYKHIQMVQRFIGKVIRDFIRRSEGHDQSKLVSPEVEVFDEFTPKLAGITYGSEEYRACLAAMKPAIDHHNAANDHHPEHFKYWECGACSKRFPDDTTWGTICDACGCNVNEQYGIRGMSLVDLTEMLCDWKAATLRHDDGDIRRSIEINQERFGYSDELKQILINTLPLIEGPQSPGG
jgi:hypothetical protein